MSPRKVTNALILSRQQISYMPRSEVSGKRTMGTYKKLDGSEANVLLEWHPVVCNDIETRVAKLLGSIPNDGDANRLEEIRTLKFQGLLKADGFLRPEGRALPALVYECAQKPINLKEVLLTIEKPPPLERRVLAGIIVTQIRSLNVHFELYHGRLRTESFVFFGSPKRPNLTNPYVLDWWRPVIPNMYQDPQYRADERRCWFHDVWPLMMVLSEIAEWKPIDGSPSDPRELKLKQEQRKRQVMDPNWKGELLVMVMKHGFGLLENDRTVLEKYTKKDIKRFFDTLCDFFEDY